MLKNREHIEKQDLAVMQFYNNPYRKKNSEFPFENVPFQETKKEEHHNDFNSLVDMLPKNPIRKK